MVKIQHNSLKLNLLNIINKIDMNKNYVYLYFEDKVHLAQHIVP